MRKQNESAAARGAEKTGCTHPKDHVCSLCKDLGSETPLARELQPYETDGLWRVEINQFSNTADIRTAVRDGDEIIAADISHYEADRIVTTHNKSVIAWNRRAPLTSTPDSEGATRTPQVGRSEETGSIPVTQYDADQNMLDFWIRTSNAESKADRSWWNDCWEAALLYARTVPLTSSLPQSPTLTEGKEKSVWIRTSERAPTNKNADVFGKVYAHSKEGRSFTVDWTNFYWHNEGKRLLDEAVKNWPFWMPIPALPEKEEQPEKILD